MLTQNDLNDRFDIEQKLGVGASATVFKAFDKKRKSSVALKVLHPHLLESGSAKRRLQAEIVASSKIAHPGVVKIYDFIERDHCFLVMEYIEGPTLEQLMIRGPHSPDLVLNILMQLLDILEQVHEQGIVHRDIKPANLKLSGPDKSLRLMDFGLASISEWQSLTGASSAIGTLGFAAPEQITGKQIDLRADLYSAACVGISLIGGKPIPPAIAGQDVNQLINHIFQAQSLSDLKLQDTFIKALSFLPDERYATASTFRLALEGEQLESRPTNPCEACGAPIPGNAGRCLNCGNSVLLIEPGKFNVLLTEAGSTDSMSKSASDVAGILDGVSESVVFQIFKNSPVYIGAGLSYKTARNISDRLAKFGLSALALLNSKDPLGLRALSKREGTEMVAGIIIGFSVLILLFIHVPFLGRAGRGMKGSAIFLWLAFTFLTYTVMVLQLLAKKNDVLFIGKKRIGASLNKNLDLCFKLTSNPTARPVVYQALEGIAEFKKTVKVFGERVGLHNLAGPITQLNTSVRLFAKKIEIISGLLNENPEGIIELQLLELEKKADSAESADEMIAYTDALKSKLEMAEQIETAKAQYRVLIAQLLQIQASTEVCSIRIRNMVAQEQSDWDPTIQQVTRELDHRISSVASIQQELAEIK
jgi:serine/threonine protein kinase